MKYSVIVRPEAETDGLYFIVEQNKVIILAIFHAKRNPALLNKRGQ